MHSMGFVGMRPKKKYPSYKGKYGKVADNIVNRDFSTLDYYKNGLRIYFNLISLGKCYLSTILDMNTNEIVAYDLALRPNL